MKVSELKESYEQGNLVRDLIELKPYVGCIEKKLLCERIVEQSLSVENDMLVCDPFMKKLTIDCGIVGLYTDVELDGEYITNDYDFLCESGIIKYVLEHMNEDEYYFIRGMVDSLIKNKLEASNSIPAVINSALNKLIEKIPTDKQLGKLIKVASKELQKFDPAKLKSLNEIYGLVNQPVK